MSVSEALREAAEAAEFTKQDMVTWLEYDYSTVHSWFNSDVNPLPLKHKHVIRRLDLLRRILKAAKQLPVPPSISQYERKAYIEKVRDHALGRIPKAGSADRRV